MKTSKILLMAVMHLVALSSLITLSGCGWLLDRADRKQDLSPDQPYWLVTAAERRGTYVFPAPKQDNTKAIAICAEPSPDVAMNFVSQFVGKLDAKKLQTDLLGSAELRRDVFQLATRSQMLQFFRSAMYRLCEQSMNNNLSNEQIQDLYQKTIEASLRMAEVEFANRDFDSVEKAIQYSQQMIRGLPTEKQAKAKELFEQKTSAEDELKKLFKQDSQQNGQP